MRGEKYGQHHSSCLGLWHSLSWLCCESITPLSLIGRDGLSSESLFLRRKNQFPGARPTKAQPCSTRPADGVRLSRSAVPGLCFQVTPHSAAPPRPPSLPLLSFVSFNYSPTESLKGEEGGMKRSRLSPKMSQVPGFASC